MIINNNEVLPKNYSNISNIIYGYQNRNNTFIIEYESNIIDKPKIKYDKYELPCKINSNNLICEITSNILNYDVNNQTNLIHYPIDIYTLCENRRSGFNISVYKAKLDMNMIKYSYSVKEKCNKYYKDMKIFINIEKNRTEPLNYHDSLFNGIYLVKEDQKIKVICENADFENTLEAKLTCKADNDTINVPGNYSLVFYSNNTNRYLLNISNYTEYISLSKYKYIKPEVKEYKFNYDLYNYIKNVFYSKIEFQEELTEKTTPLIKRKDNNDLLNCIIDIKNAKNLKCFVNKTDFDFPVKNNTYYNYSIINLCGFEEENISVDYSLHLKIPEKSYTHIYIIAGSVLGIGIIIGIVLIIIHKRASSRIDKQLLQFDALTQLQS